MNGSPWLSLGLLGVGLFSCPQAAGADQQPPGANRAAGAAAEAPLDLGDEAVLSRDISLYESGRYGECVTALSATLAANAGAKTLRPEQVEQAQTYLAACLVADGKLADADRVFGEAIRANPQMRAPDSLVFPQSVIDRFLRVRERLLSTIREAEEKKIRDAAARVQQQDERRKREAEALQKLRDLARQETVIEKNRRWLASVPFGVGQFQNRDNVGGWIFLGSEVALLGTALTAMTIDQRLANKAQVPGVDPRELSSKRQDAYRVLVAATWGFGLAAAAGIVHAHLRFVPEHRSIRRRELPSSVARFPSQSLEVGLLHSESGLGLHLIGSF